MFGIRREKNLSPFHLESCACPKTQNPVLNSVWTPIIGSDLKTTHSLRSITFKHVPKEIFTSSEMECDQEMATCIIPLENNLQRWFITKNNFKSRLAVIHQVPINNSHLTAFEMYISAHFNSCNVLTWINWISPTGGWIKYFSLLFYHSISLPFYHN